MGGTYVHGYHRRENERLQDQAGTLTDLLHSDTAYPSGSRVLEVGCGVGAQTVTLARRSPDARFTSFDVSADSVAEAERRADRAGLTNVEFRQADVFALPFDAESFDHVFVCFVLEHLSRPVEALVILSGLLRPGGTITVIEGDHGSAYFYPESPAAHAAIQCLVTLQQEAGGNALIGRQLYPLMVEAGFDAIRVSPRMVYVDSSRPDLVDGFTRKTFTAMIEGVRGPAIAAGLIEPETFDAGVQALHRTTEADGVFCYTFFKGVGEKGDARRQTEQRMTDTTGSYPQGRAPEPGPETQRLGALVGRWRSEGHVIADPPVPITGTDVYEWLPGGFFLVHHVDVVVGDQPVQALEIIGEYDAATDSFLCRAYDNEGSVTLMRARVDDQGVWTFSGGGDVAQAALPESADAPGAVRSTLSVSDDRNTMTALWERTDDQSVWQRWMNMTFTRMQ